MNISRLCVLAITLFAVSLSAPALAADELVFINQTSTDIEQIWAATKGHEPFRITRRIPVNTKFAFKEPAKLRGCSRIFVQPYFSGSIQFFTPFYFEDAGSVLFEEKNYGKDEHARALPVLRAAATGDSYYIPAGLPFYLLHGFISQGMTEQDVEDWLIPVRLPGEATGKHAVAVGDLSWTYQELELAYKEGASGKYISEMSLSAPYAPEFAGLILDDFAKEGLTPLRFEVEGQPPLSLPADTAKNTPEPWSQVKDLLVKHLSGETRMTTCSVVAGSSVVTYELSLQPSEHLLLITINR